MQPESVQAAHPSRMALWWPRLGIVVWAVLFAIALYARQHMHGNEQMALFWYGSLLSCLLGFVLCVAQCALREQRPLRWAALLLLVPLLYPVAARLQAASVAMHHGAIGQFSLAWPANNSASRTVDGASVARLYFAGKPISLCERVGAAASRLRAACRRSRVGARST